MNDSIDVLVGEMARLSIPTATGQGYQRLEHEIEYSLDLVRDSNERIIKATQEEARQLLRTHGYRLPTAAEIQVLIEKGPNDRAFDDMFGRKGKYVKIPLNIRPSSWEWTDTTLLKPPVDRDFEDIKKTEKTYGEERDYYLRIVSEGGSRVGEIWVPSGDSFVREWSPFGIPLKVIWNRIGHKFDYNMETYLKHGLECHQWDRPETVFKFAHYYDLVGVLLDRGWGLQGGDFDMHANHQPTVKDGRSGFRAVRGPLPKYELLG